MLKAVHCIGLLQIVEVRVSPKESTDIKLTLRYMLSWTLSNNNLICLVDNSKTKIEVQALVFSLCLSLSGSFQMVLTNFDNELNRAQLIYWFSKIIVNIGLSQIYQYWPICLFVFYMH